ncbi:hypothetical protein Leryth_009408 [Lithospermum erythrorhizon]|nr:hypothetical protein Leryth_009408 [Lithospermum erythrorhizon]
MALGKYSRVDNKKSSGYCSTVTIVGLVALCLAGVWMFTSSSVVPVQNSDVSSSENKNEVSTKAIVSDTNENNGTGNDGTDSSVNDPKSKQFEDNLADLPEDATKQGANSQQEENSTNVDNGKSTEENQEEETEGKKKEGESTSEENGETIKKEGESNTNNIDSEGGETKEGKSDADGASEEASNETKSDTEEGEKKSEESSVETQTEDKGDGQIQEKVDEKKDDSDKGSDTATSSEIYPSGAQSELLNETTTQSGSFSTQAAESKNANESQNSLGQGSQTAYNWKVCDTSAGPDYIPCLDNMEAIRHLTSTKHYEHRERHCPENPPTCLVPLPEGYQRSIEWPTSREKIWYHNVPHTKLAEIKGHQNWVKVSGEHLIFPGGGTQFKNGALHYIDFIQQVGSTVHVENSVYSLNHLLGERSRVVLDVGCGVASFGGFLFDRDVLTMSLAPKDEHEAQVQFALERGIPAISAVMGTCFTHSGETLISLSLCSVVGVLPGISRLLLELNRLLRPGGYFVWSATPVYQKLDEDVEIWEAMKKLTKSMCWELVSITKDRVNKVGIAVYRKPTSNECYEQRKQNDPPLCSESDDPDAAWNTHACIKYQFLNLLVDLNGLKCGLPEWQKHLIGCQAPKLEFMGNPHLRILLQIINTGSVFAAALREMKVWVMNVVSIDSPDTLPIIYERGLSGIYHNWCESFSTYPRTYDLLHADHLFSKIKAKCNYMAFIAEVDRLLRPEGNIIVRDNVQTITELENMFRSMNWEIRMTFSKDNEGLLCAMKTKWRPDDSERVTYAIA